MSTGSSTLSVSLLQSFLLASKKFHRTGTRQPDDAEKSVLCSNELLTETRPALLLQSPCARRRDLLSYNLGLPLVLHPSLLSSLEYSTMSRAVAQSTGSEAESKEREMDGTVSWAHLMFLVILSNLLSRTVAQSVNLCSIVRACDRIYVVDIR